MSKILQLVLPFWVMARKYAKSYTDSRMTGLVGLAYGLALENGVMKMTVYDSRAITFQDNLGFIMVFGNDCFRVIKIEAYIIAPCTDSISPGQ